MTPGRAAVSGISADGSATLAISCLRIPGAQDRIVREVAIHWQEHDYAPLLAHQQGFERFGDPDEFVRRLLAGRVYAVAQPNGRMRSSSPPG